MDKRLEKLRRRETERLKRELGAAVERVRHYRAKYPAINQNDWGYYLDGSQRRDFGSTGVATLDYRMWEVGSLFGRRLYLYEEVAPGTKAAVDDCALYGTDTYGLAVDDPERFTYGGLHDGIATIDLETLVEGADYTLDAIVWMSGALGRLFPTDKAFQRAVKTFTKEFVHQAAGDLQFDQVHAP